jgi:hypothetical protein
LFSPTRVRPPARRSAGNVLVRSPLDKQHEKEKEKEKKKKRFQYIPYSKSSFFSNLKTET